MRLNNWLCFFSHEKTMNECQKDERHEEKMNLRKREGYQSGIPGERIRVQSVRTDKPINQHRIDKLTCRKVRFLFGLVNMCLSQCC